MSFHYIKNLSAVVFLSGLILTACSNSSDDTLPLPGERISILDLQKELKPSLSEDKTLNVTIPEAASNSSWPQAGGYAHHAMQNLLLGPSEQIEKIWDTSIGRGVSKALPLTSRPITAAGKVYTLDTNHKVSAFHDQTGRLLWRVNVEHAIESETVISGGLSYGEGALLVTNGYNEVIALSPENGSQLWRTKIKAPSRAAPTIKNGRVFVIQMNNSVTALSLKDGNIIWEHEGIAETTGLLGAASPAVDNSVVIAALSSGDLTALRVENGAVVWTDNLSSLNRYSGLSSLSDIRGMPVLSGDIAIAVSYGGKMIALEKQNGNRIWQANISSAETPWIVGDTVFTISSEQQLIALSLYNGSVLWIKDLPKYENPEKRKSPLRWIGPIMGSGRLILTSTNGVIHEYNPTNGEFLTQWDTKKDISLPPIVSSGSLFLLSNDGRLLAYR